VKLATYSFNDKDVVGLACADGFVDLSTRFGYRGMRDALADFDRIRNVAQTQPDHTFSQVQFRPVVADPAHVYGVGSNYADHAKEIKDAGIDRPVATHPAIFMRYPETLVGHDSPIVMPHVSGDFDFEAELAIIIGTGGRYIDEKRALDHVAGYTCCNDGSIRDWQFHSSQVGPGKNFLATGSLGPFLVTADELPDVQELDIRLVLNGQEMQHSNTRNLIFGLAEIISYVSAFIPLVPGDVIATGTPAGVGFSRNPKFYMKVGDTCEVIVEKVGTLRNTVVAEELLPSLNSASLIAERS
jgi:2-keto-4-pentenoate hydratase/2-oxohepta-3-ene-1,7-dioic acid hydratase in catechol pathway